ncbi:MAG: DUF92 domain-containing protein [Anaerolineales bacterium]|nr:DUF92 domain-containing protein [Anaerolineales bacterium]
MQFFIGVIFGIVISLLAWRAGSLSTSGALAAAISGSLIFGLGGFPWAALLLTFFITSSALSRLFKRRKLALSEKFAKGDRRDWGQVLANGGLGAVLVIGMAWLGDGRSLDSWWWLVYAGAMAAVNADTWATELGVLNPRQPRLVTTWQRVEPGTSGGVSHSGTLASLAGAGLVGLVAAVFSFGNGWQAALVLLLAVTLGGASGSLFDSFLGATVQAIYTCPQCRKETERYPVHTCGTATLPRRGWRWLNNDLVNFLASAAGGLVTLGLWMLLT